MSSPTSLGAGQAAAPSPSTAAATRRIIDAPMRMFHWLFALSFAGAYLSAEGEHWRALHLTLGYTMLGLLAARVVYGLVGPPQARLSLMWRKLSGGPAWLSALKAGLGQGLVPNATVLRQGQNLAMALAVILLLAVTLPLTFSGIGAFHEWGDAWLGDGLAELHEALGEAMLFIVFAHLALIAGLSLLRRKNVAGPMLTGRTEGRGPDLVRHNRAGLAVLLLAAVLAWFAWDWSQSPNGLVTPTGIASLGSGHSNDDDDDD